jgi:hypothetical protein
VGKLFVGPPGELGSQPASPGVLSPPVVRTRALCDPEDRRAAEKRIVGGLKCAIDAHGPIDKELVGSAARRVAGLLTQR